METIAGPCRHGGRLFAGGLRQRRDRPRPADGGDRPARLDDDAGAGGGDPGGAVAGHQCLAVRGRRRLARAAAAHVAAARRHLHRHLRRRAAAAARHGRAGDHVARRGARALCRARTVQRAVLGAAARAKAGSACWPASPPASFRWRPASSPYRACPISRRWVSSATGWCRRSACRSRSRPSRWRSRFIMRAR